MEKFNKLSKAEMKKISGGGDKVCYVGNWCYIETRPGFIDFGPWCHVPDSGTGCVCEFEGNVGDVTPCYVNNNPPS